MTRSNSRSKRRKWAVEWPTFGLLVFCYVAWFALGLLLYPVAPICAMCLFPVLIVLHSSLQHEVLHGHPTRSRLVNEMLVFFPLGLFFPYRRYKARHLQHHDDERLTDPYDDPESYYTAAGSWAQLSEIMKILLAWNNTFIGRLTIGPALSVAGFAISESRKVRSDDKIRTAWILHMLGLAGVVATVQLIFGIPIWLYCISAYIGLSVLKIRSYCEHQWSETPEGRTIIIERTALSLLFLNNNLHLVHHKLPTVPWYRLPAIYSERRGEWHEMNGHYVFRNYSAILRKFAFRAKEPVIHPVLRRDAGDGAQQTRIPNAKSVFPDASSDELDLFGKID